MRRAICVLTLAALLALIPQAGLAISGQEALFGGDSVDISEIESVPEVSIADTGDISDYHSLQLGDRDGEDNTAYIVFLQNRLIELGYLSDSADGVFGGNTESAVRAFQRNNNLPETGIANVETQKLLYSSQALKASAGDANDMVGSDTTRVQMALATWGFYGGTVDGVMGAGTESAIAAFKKYMSKFYPAFGVTPTPVPTPTPNPDGMFAEMDMVIDEPIVKENKRGWSDGTITTAVMEYIDGVKPFEVFQMTIQNGDRGDEALRVQTRLHQLKYLYATDGAFGNLSANALKYFQRKNGLPQSGIADEETQRVLFSAKAIAGEEYVFPYKLIVDISDQKVYVGEWKGSSYEGPKKTFTVATGRKETPTPLGTYQAGGKASGEWYYFKQYNCYAKWAYQIVGGILFHSNTVSSTSQKPSNGNLGHRASHGCIRMKVEDVKWIYDNCPEGTTVVIQD